MFDPNHPLANLRPAAYNPRRIDDEAFAELRRSVSTLGCVRPLIVDGVSGTLVAGHQRRRALIAEGFTHAPVYILSALDPSDEIRFNQLHNGTDFEIGASAQVPPHKPGWVDVAAADIQGELGPGAPIRNEIARLIARYGPWGGCVATESGRVVSAAQYTLSCWQMYAPCRVCYIEENAEALSLLSKCYGVFDYSAIPRTPWHQSFCQPPRLTGDVMGSRLYDKVVIPALKPGMRVLDFGCGTGAYVRELAARGIRITGMEFYPRKDGKFDIPAAHAMATVLHAELTAHGRFDMVVADSVVNATGNPDVSRDVLLTMSALCKPNGIMAFSGISRENAEKPMQRTNRIRRSGNIRDVHFYDQHGVTAIRYRGEWFFQQALRLEAVQELARWAAGAEPVVKRGDWMWTALVTHADPHSLSDLLGAVKREFDLPYPGGITLEVSDAICASVCETITRSRNVSLA